MASDAAPNVKKLLALVVLLPLTPGPSPARGEGSPQLTLSPGGRGWPQSGRVRGETTPR